MGNRTDDGETVDDVSSLRTVTLVYDSAEDNETVTVFSDAVVPHHSVSTARGQEMSLSPVLTVSEAPPSALTGSSSSSSASSSSQEETFSPSSVSSVDVVNEAPSAGHEAVNWNLSVYSSSLTSLSSSDSLTPPLPPLLLPSEGDVVSIPPSLTLSLSSNLLRDVDLTAFVRTSLWSRPPRSLFFSAQVLSSCCSSHFNPTPAGLSVERTLVPVPLSQLRPSSRVNPTPAGLSVERTLVPIPHSQLQLSFRTTALLHRHSSSNDRRRDNLSPESPTAATVMPVTMVMDRMTRSCDSFSSSLTFNVDRDVLSHDLSPSSETPPSALALDFRVFPSLTHPFLSPLPLFPHSFPPPLSSLLVRTWFPLAASLQPHPDNHPQSISLSINQSLHLSKVSAPSDDKLKHSLPLVSDKVCLDESQTFEDGETTTDIKFNATDVKFNIVDTAAVSFPLQTEAADVSVHTPPLSSSPSLIIEDPHRGLVSGFTELRPPVSGDRTSNTTEAAIGGAHQSADPTSSKLTPPSHPSVSDYTGDPDLPRAPPPVATSASPLKISSPALMALKQATAPPTHRSPPVDLSGKATLPCRCKRHFDLTCQCGVSSGTKDVFYRLSFVVQDRHNALTQPHVQRAVEFWLKQTFENWTQSVSVDNISVYTGQSGDNMSSYMCRALLIHSHVTNESLGIAAVSVRLSSEEGQMRSGLQVRAGSMDVTLLENCPEENPLPYRWPESRPTVSRFLPCFPNKDQKTSRTCLINLQNYSSYWSEADTTNCTDINSILVSAENAAAVAEQLANITNTELPSDEVSKVVSKVQELVNIAKINATLANTVVTIISNVMTSSETLQSATSEKALKTVDELAQKVEFNGPSISITSRHLALGISTFNTTVFNGTSFSALIPTNTTNPKVVFESESVDPVAQVRLPASLLSSVSLTESNRAVLSRINFMFFKKTSLFQREQDGRSLNSYVVASSVGNLSISDLKDPVEIEIVHLSEQLNLNPVCMFWDFSLNNGAGGWNADGCSVSEQSSSNKTVCLCDHMTHFGILMDISGVSAHIDSKNNKILTFITYIGCGVSAIFSAATLLTYVAFEKIRRDYPSKILMNLSSSLLFLNMTFLLDGWLAALDAPWLCVSVAVFLHYFLLTTFTWMGLESIHMYIALVKVFNTYIRRYILKFCVVGWGLPAVVVGIVVAVDKNSYGLQEYGRVEAGEGSEFCWIKNQVVFYVTCVGYFCVVFLLNVAMFVVVMLQICGRNGKRSNRSLREEILRNLRSVISLTFLLGMTWGFALFAWGPVSLAFMYLFSIFNSLQGLFIFIFHCAMKENVQKQWRRYLCCGRFRLSDNSDWSKTATNNTKKVSSDNLGKSLSSSSFSSSTANWTSKAKATLNPFTKRHSNTDKSYSNQTSPKCVSSSSSSSDMEPSSSSSSILPVSQMIDKVKGYCSTRSDNFYKNIIMSDSFAHSTRF